MISSKILYNPGTNDTLRWTNCFVPASNTHICCVCFSTDPMYVSGRSKMCSNCVFFVYVSSIVFPFFGDFFTLPPAPPAFGAMFSSRKTVAIAFPSARCSPARIVVMVRWIVFAHVLAEMSKNG